MGFLQT